MRTTLVGGWVAHRVFVGCAPLFVGCAPVFVGCTPLVCRLHTPRLWVAPPGFFFGTQSEEQSVQRVTHENNACRLTQQPKPHEIPQ